MAEYIKALKTLTRRVRQERETVLITSIKNKQGWLVPGHRLLAVLIWCLLGVPLRLEHSHHHIRDRPDHLLRVSIEFLLSPLQCTQSLIYFILLLIVLGKETSAVSQRISPCSTLTSSTASPPASSPCSTLPPASAQDVTAKDGGYGAVTSPTSTLESRDSGIIELAEDS
ncbi:UNVERIFIED_CONTAM: hypothetical protein K2H54_009100 [Gekko kuhli]